VTAITAAEIVWRYSVKTGSAGDSTAGTAAGSLGKYASTTAWAGGVANDLFDDISGAENAASTVDYRGVAILNNNATNVLQNPVAYISAETAGGASIAIATDNIAASAKASASAQMAEIANETTAPTGVSAFSSPTTIGTGLALSNIAVGFVKGLWVRRTAANTSALSADGVTLAVTGDTGNL
jgi:hypothetical protein